MLIDGGIDRTPFCLLLFRANVGDVEIGFLQVSQYILFRRFILNRFFRIPVQWWGRNDGRHDLSCQILKYGFQFRKVGIYLHVGSKHRHVLQAFQGYLFFDGLCSFDSLSESDDRHAVLRTSFKDGSRLLAGVIGQCLFCHMCVVQSNGIDITGGFSVCCQVEWNGIFGQELPVVWIQEEREHRYLFSLV